MHSKSLSSKLGEEERIGRNRDRRREIYRTSYEKLGYIYSLVYEDNKLDESKTIKDRIRNELLKLRR